MKGNETPGVLRYRIKPKPVAEEQVTAAKYEPGTALDALLAVARMADHRAELAEVRLPSETVLLVRYTRGDECELDWEVIRPGQYLAFSRPHYFLYGTDDDDLEQFYELST